METSTESELLLNDSTTNTQTQVIVDELAPAVETSINIQSSNECDIITTITTGAKEIRDNEDEEPPSNHHHSPPLAPPHLPQQQQDNDLVTKVDALNISAAANSNSDNNGFVSMVRGGEQLDLSTTVVRNLNCDSLNSLLVYASSDSSSSSCKDSSGSEESDDEDLKKIDLKKKKKVVLLDSDDDDDDDSSSSSSSSTVDSDNEVQVRQKTKIKRQTLRIDDQIAKTTTKPNNFFIDEFDPINLPPIADVPSTLADTDIKNPAEYSQIGNVLGIIGKLVTVAALPDLPAYDLDTLLFVLLLDDKDDKKMILKPLGYIYEVLGPVTSPIYGVRFNSIEDIQERGAFKGVPVYLAPKSHYTKYVFLQQLLKIKGSDGSWLGDEEVPSEFADYSDDEQEYLAKKSRRRSGGGTQVSLSPSPSMKRPHDSSDQRQWSSSGNHQEQQRRRTSKNFNTPTRYRNNRNGNNYRTTTTNGGSVGPLNPHPVPLFDPTVPPPNMRSVQPTYFPANVVMSPLPPPPPPPSDYSYINQ